jgi:hypothetical protein
LTFRDRVAYYCHFHPFVYAEMSSPLAPASEIHLFPDDHLPLRPSDPSSETDIPYNRQLDALNCFLSIPSIICDSIIGVPAFPHPNRVGRQLPLHLLNDLNASQRAAVECAFSNRLCLIQGPPGTGKTNVIAAYAHAIVSSGGGKILVCAPSNAAVRCVAKRIYSKVPNVVIHLSKSVESSDESDSFLSSKGRWQTIQSPEGDEWRNFQMRDSDGPVLTPGERKRMT